MIKWLIILLASTSFAADWYVATNGTYDGAGTFASPWDLVTGLTNNSLATSSNYAVVSGDTIWVRGGIYSGSYTSSLTCATNGHITVRNYPGERPIIQAPSNSIGLWINGSATWYWGLEFTCFNPNRYREVGAFGGGIYNFAPWSKIINCFIHDTDGSGITVGQNATNSETTGNIICNFGYESPARGAGHAIYDQSKGGTHVNVDNICFNGYCYGIHNYQESDKMWFYDVHHNTLFRNGYASEDYRLTCNLEIGGLVPVLGTICNSNYIWSGHDSIADPIVTMGYGGDTNGTLEFIGNVIGGGKHDVRRYTNATWMHNTWVSELRATVVNAPPINDYTWNSNRYFLGIAKPFWIDYSLPTATNMTFAQWQAYTGWDSDSTYTSTMPTTNEYYIITNPYENRRTITIYNWGLSNNVDIDLTGRVPPSTIRIRSVENYPTNVVLVTNYTGSGTITLPMTNLPVSQAVNCTNVLAPSGPEFNVFVLDYTFRKSQLISRTSTISSVTNWH